MAGVCSGLLGMESSAGAMGAANMPGQAMAVVQEVHAAQVAQSWEFLYTHFWPAFGRVFTGNLFDLEVKDVGTARVAKLFNTLSLIRSIEVGARDRLRIVLKEKGRSDTIPSATLQSICNRASAGRLLQELDAMPLEDLCK